ncbi:hypothetical protein CAEBREN_04383 [Caenorhabditis brenneri]|uniref:Uncharacterized protein n=1 Tax=Caenorhabditis brenneri TaxID=135651 RepID=G0ND53_CAEBE|nr:hypothetical protein CAEBREN_04383 [Caenorhabditis brenneri]
MDIVEIEVNDETASSNNARRVSKNAPHDQIVVQNNALGVQNAARLLNNVQRAIPQTAVTQTASDCPLLMGLLNSKEKILNIGTGQVGTHRLSEQRSSNVGGIPSTKRKTGGISNNPHEADNSRCETNNERTTKTLEERGISNAKPPNLPQPEFALYSKRQIDEIKQLLAVKSRESQKTIYQLQKDMEAKMEEMRQDFKNSILQKEEEIMYLEDEIRMKDVRIADQCSIFQNYVNRTERAYDGKLKEIQKEMEKTAHILEEKDRRHQKDQKEKEELQKKIDQLQTSQQVFRARECFNEHDDEPTTSNPITEPIEKVRMQLIKQTKTGHKRQSDNIDDSTKKKKIRKNNYGSFD